MEQATEGVVAAVGVPLLVAPGAAIPQVEAVDGHGQRARREPLHEQVRIGVRAEEEIARRVELPGDHDLWRVRLGDEVRAGHDGVPFWSIASRWPAPRISCWRPGGSSPASNTMAAQTVRMITTTTAESDVEQNRSAHGVPPFLA